ncbi:MAG: UDP-N-acetylenolpyruvoylglucosamine reductase, partial [Oscillospiraceae bacterium]|nr:UDP-N-acetylenolpyruvoylglucosamine reductase [Oscillospiraceae bacterium]
AFSDGSRMILSARLHLSLGDGDQIQREMEQLMERRRSKQPLELPSAGSTFRRPKEGYAAVLIDQCGLKGLTVGGAQVSEKHAGFIVNRGGATCRDILNLMDQVRNRVLEQTGVALEPEVKLLGEEFAWNS